MAIQSGTQAGKKKLWWFILPFIVLILLVIAKFAINTHETTKENSVVATTEQPKTNNTPSPPPTAYFSQNDLVQMIEKDEDYIAGVCKKGGFRYEVKGEVNFNYRKEHYDNGNYYYDGEQITTWKDLPNRLNYCIVSEYLYQQFVSSILQSNPRRLSKNEYDRDYSDSAHYLINNCVFIPIGFKKEFDGYCVVAIRKDKINDKNTADSEKSTSTENNSDSQDGNKYFVIKSEKAGVYDYTGQDSPKRFLKKGDKVRYYETVGEFIRCGYENEEGVPLEGYIHYTDVGGINKNKQVIIE